MSKVSIRGVEWAYDDTGKSADPAATPIVLIHGFPLDRRVWSHVTRELSRQRRVISVDLKGFGQTPLSAGFTMTSLADDLGSFADAVGLKRLVLAGLSMGGYVALDFASRHADRLAAIVLVDTKADADTEPQKQNRQRMIDLVRKSGSKAIADDMLPNMVGEETTSDRPDIVQNLRQIMESCPPKTIETALAAMRDRPDYNDVLARLTMPVLILVGEHDAITPPKAALSMSQKAQHAQVRIVPQAGHMSPIEVPMTVASLMNEFLQSAVDGK